ncbi:hypothetical protein FIBSPDRAFT_869103 [Athelia psychrophila]|uniref:Uncharacterized protein n=1 Tax=Athelia psychrophila TaxID=1759441 RepID=A0A166CF35_9AGAM|nr:hypothetical protein FIBSPDRAFT_869103 [Fibularhizoctonia sp. CBS 109695]
MAISDFLQRESGGMTLTAEHYSLRHHIFSVLKPCVICASQKNTDSPYQVD